MGKRVTKFEGRANPRTVRLKPLQIDTKESTLIIGRCFVPKEVWQNPDKSFKFRVTVEVKEDG